MWTTRSNVLVEVAKCAGARGVGVTRSFSFPAHLWWKSASRTLLRYGEVVPRGRGRRWFLGVLVSGSLVSYHHLLKPAAALALCRQRHDAQHSHRLIPSIHTNPQAKQAFDWTLFAKYIWPDMFFLLIAVGSAVVAAFLNVSIPLELGKMINSIALFQAGQEMSDYLRQLLPSATKLLVLYSLQALSTFVYITALSVAGERLSIRLRLDLFKSLLRQDVAFFDEHKTGELISRLSGDVQELKSSFKLVVGQGLRSTTQVLGCVFSLFLISPQMTVLMGVALPVMVAMGTVLGSILRRWSRQSQEQMAIATGVADEAIGNIQTVRAFAMEDYENKLYESQLVKSRYMSTQLGVGVALLQALSHLAINGMVLLVVGHGGLLLATNQISPGSLMAFLVATQTIQRSLASLSVLSGQVVRGMSAGGRVWEYMQLQPRVPLHVGQTLHIGSLHGGIIFDNVTFTYPTRPNQEVLSDLCLELPAGKVTALCGPSGAGKSTVAALLERFYEPDKGVIMLDGISVSDLDPSWLRGTVVGYISQEPVLFATSVMENIRYGRPSASDQEVVEAARLAHAHNFVQEFPQGYQTVLGERGQTLSGGQKQRVAIARALLKNPAVLILDEATSALDTQTESLVQQALETACRGRTVLLIAHRLSTIRDADQIAVLQQGRLKELGTHKELVAKGGLYSELIRRQTVLDY